MPSQIGKLSVQLPRRLKFVVRIKFEKSTDEDGDVGAKRVSRTSVFLSESKAQQSLLRAVGLDWTLWESSIN